MKLISRLPTSRIAGAALAATVLIAAALAGAAPARALNAEEKALLEKIQQYVNRITTVKTRFTQTSPTGRKAQGTIYIKRPGKLRIDFDPPSEMKIVTTRLWLVVYEQKGAEPQNYPLNSTPAGILVQESIDFNGGDLRVTGMRQSGSAVFVTLVRAKNPGQGSMTLIFRREPLALSGWVVTDSQGQRTQVQLSNTQTGVALGPEVFALDQNVRTPGVER